MENLGDGNGYLKKKLEITSGDTIVFLYIKWILRVLDSDGIT